jgi:DNA-binding response OmpR family regulator
MRVLLVENCRLMTRALKQGLEREGFTVDVALDGRVAEDLAAAANYDVIILDLGPPAADDSAMVRRWRGKGIRSHVLVLITDDEDGTPEPDPVGDDYMAKPFCLQELLARLRALTRRGCSAGAPLMHVHDLEIDTSARTARRGGRHIHLTRREYEILELLALHRGKVVTRSMIWEHLYDDQDANTSNVIDVYIRYLRKKIDGHTSPPLILTRRRQGYLLRGD